MSSETNSVIVPISPLAPGWRQISPVIKTLTTVGDVLYAWDGYTQAVLRYDQSLMYWEQVGDACDQVIGSKSALYSLTDHTGAGTVKQFDDIHNVWNTIGAGFQVLIVGGEAVYGIVMNGDIYQYQHTAGPWLRIGGAGYQFVANDIALYGITPDQKDVLQYTPQSGWQIIAANASRSWNLLIAGGGQIYAIMVDQNIYQYQHTKGPWQQIGSPGYQFVAQGNRLIGISPDQHNIGQYLNGPYIWKNIWSSKIETMKQVVLGDTFVFGITSSAATLLSDIT